VRAAPGEILPSALGRNSGQSGACLHRFGSAGIYRRPRGTHGSQGQSSSEEDDGQDDEQEGGSKRDLHQGEGQHAGRGRVAGQGEDHQEVPGLGLHGEGLGGPRDGPAQVEDRRRHRERVRARLRGHRVEEESRRRAEGGGQGRGAHPARDPTRIARARPIAWHVFEQLKKQKIPTQRILFNEITKKAIQEAILKPLELNRQLYDAQQARRVLDRLVGYKISPILWTKVRRGLSAGRVQSVAVRLVVEREAEISKFVPVEYWSIEADLKAALPPQFRSKLIKLDGEKAELPNGDVARPLVDEIKTAKFTVAEVIRKERRRNAPPPFITSKLQQDAANRLGFTAKKTMTLAQRLYEGVELGDEGTDCAHHLHAHRLGAALARRDRRRARLRDHPVGKEYLPAEPVQFKTKKSAQDAHEAIRPTSLEHPPEKVQQYLERDVYRLYELIWNRFVACQMVPAVFDQTTADIAAGRATFRATGQILKFPGYLAVYGQEAEQPQEEAGAEKMEARTRRRATSRASFRRSRRDRSSR